MKQTAVEFLQLLAEVGMQQKERAIALLWWHGVDDPNVSVEVKQICDELFEAGYARPNVTLLGRRLKADPRTAKGDGKGLRIKVNKRKEVEDAYGELLERRPIPKSNAVLPHELFREARPYVQRVVDQINASYTTGLFDCTAVMCRRLLETLIIDAYEQAGLGDEMKGSDDHFMMFSGLLSQIEKHNRLSISRNAIGALKDFKKLGDLSSHSRRFNARATDIDPLRQSLRVASEDLLHLSGQG